MIWGVNAKDRADPVRVDDAFPAIVSKSQFHRVANLMRSRAPKIVNPRRAASPFLLSELRDRQELLEDEASAARAVLTQRRSVLDDVDTVEAYAKEMRDFLKHSELTERKAFIQSFVKEIVVIPGDALLRYTVPMPSDSLIPGKAIEKLALNGPVLVSVHRSPLARIQTIHREQPDSPTRIDFCLLYLT